MSGKKKGHTHIKKKKQKKEGKNNSRPFSFFPRCGGKLFHQKKSGVGHGDPGGGADKQERKEVGEGGDQNDGHSYGPELPSWPHLLRGKAR